MLKALKNIVKGLLPVEVYKCMREGILNALGWGLFGIKLLLYPFALMYLYCLNLKQPTKVSSIVAARIGHLALNTDLFLRTTLGGGI